MNIITGGVTAPKGFQAAGIHCGIKDNFTTPQPDKKDLAMILSSVPCAAAGTYTRNVVKADPVILTKEHLADHQARGIIFDSGQRQRLRPQGQGERPADGPGRRCRHRPAAPGLRRLLHRHHRCGAEHPGHGEGVPSLVAALPDTPPACPDAATPSSPPTE